MLVTRKDLAEVAEIFTETGRYGLDTETTGLRPYQGDRLFSLILSNDSHAYYFNFLAYQDLDEQWVLPREETFELLKPAFANHSTTWEIHNAKFDLHMLAREGVRIKGAVWDTEALGRILYNRHFSYNLKALAAQIGLKKSDAVEEHIKKHRLYTWLESPGKKKRAKQPHYDQVPFNIMAPYGETDGKVVHQLAAHQLKALKEVAAIVPNDKLTHLVNNEMRLTKTCFEMERVGIKIDKEYCDTAYGYEMARVEDCREEFHKLTGQDLVDSGKALEKVFEQEGETIYRTAKGNPTFTDEILERYDSPLVDIIRRYRSHSKNAGTYYANFIYFADPLDRIHPNMRQGGTDTGRFSYSEPNLQNVPKEETGELKVRRAFVPTSPDWCFVMIDYDQMEYRMMLDYAGQMDVIRKILDEGLDVHEATAALMGTDRKSAKTLNFLLLYGGGIDKLAAALGVTRLKAKQLKRQYFRSLPRVEDFTQKVMNTVERRGFIFNWAGRVNHFPKFRNKEGKLDRFAYRGPNHLIQGGCADVVRMAMPNIQDYLAPHRSRMLLQVHDELLFEMHKSELHLVDDLRRIMETTYPHRHLPLTCGVDHSWVSWADKVPGNPVI